MLNKLRDECYYNAKLKGFHDEPREFGTALALIHSEVSEALEAHREGDMELVSEEFADILIRVFDTAGEHKIDLDQAVEDKMKKNRGRARLHGKRY